MVWRKIGRSLSYLIDTKDDQEALIKRSGQNLILPLYHTVANEVPIHLKHLYKVKSISQFTDDLDFFLNHYDPISLEQLYELVLNGGDKNHNYFHISFDDGLSEVYNNIAPILIKRNIPATVFLNTDFVDNRTLFYRFKASMIFEKTMDSSYLNMKYSDQPAMNKLADEFGLSFEEYLEHEKPYLSWKQVEELNRSGFSIGAHSLDHPNYVDISLNEQLKQTRESMEIVKTRLNQEIRTFSFPFTDDGVSQKYFEETKEDIDISFGCAGLKNDSTPMHLQRIPMEDNSKSAKEILRREYSYFQLRKLFGRNTIHRK